RVLRTALKCLLSLVLCLNGFFVPVAMARHAGGVHAVSEVAAEAPPCHAEIAVTSHDQPSAPKSVHAHGDKSASGKHGLSCCATGHCGCALSAAVLAVPSLMTPYAAAARRIDAASIEFATSRFAVPLRPPIA
ncbi:MAG: CopL family metal-binding regulatory protein, partial [Tahibacter sp.]